MQSLHFQTTMLQACRCKPLIRISSFLLRHVRGMVREAYECSLMDASGHSETGVPDSRRTRRRQRRRCGVGRLRRQTADEMRRPCSSACCPPLLPSRSPPCSAVARTSTSARLRVRELPAAINIQNRLIYMQEFIVEAYCPSESLHRRRGCAERTAGRTRRTRRRPTR